MVSLYIPAIAQLIQDCATSEETYDLLSRRHCLSGRAKHERLQVIALIQQARDAYPAVVAPGRELSREVIDALRSAAYLNLWGRTWWMRFQSRRRRG